EDRESRAYISLGQGSRRVNYAKVYAGFYESGRNRVPFLMVVKVGAPNEALSTARAPGNRGKRDSMVIVLSFLERCMNLVHNRITPLDFELFNLCYNLLGIDPREFKYMLVTDADTQVQDDVVFRMVSRLEADPKILAINGHIRPANPEENIVTMLQIFPLYMTFYSGLAYEACLGRVTTINGGFVMYRIWTELPGNLPAAGDTSLIGGFAAPRPDTMHMENVLLLGEEQYFGIVLLRSNPQYRFAFEPEAIAYATLPTNFFALQALQIRNLRVTFNTQVEFQHVAKHLGLMYWLISFTKLLDMI
ncbi:glycosyltransferase family 2 protein, partial [Mucor lusitanicus CBS 277.49]